MTTPTPSITPPTTEAQATIVFVTDRLPTVLQRLSELENKVEELSKVDHSKVIKESIQANVLNEVINQIPKFLPKVVSEFVNPRIESTVCDVLQKTPVFLAQPSSTPAQPSFGSAESFSIVSGKVNPDKVIRNRHHDEDQDPPAGLDKNKNISKKERILSQPIHDVEMGVEKPILNDVVNEADQPQDDVALKKDDSTWFKQPPTLETPDPEVEQRPIY
nr:hypothetical protein [Tanacetum cinerariifolium]